MRYLNAKRILAVFALVLFGGLAIAQDTLNGVPASIVFYADTIVYNAKLVTMDDPSVGLNMPVGTIAQAMAIRDKKSWRWEPMRRSWRWPDPGRKRLM